jgi:hypothetical protein
MKLLGLVTESARIARYLAAAGEASEAPRRSPSRGPRYGSSRVPRREHLDVEEDWRREGGGEESA